MEYLTKMIFSIKLLRYAGIILVILVVWHMILEGLINSQLEKNIQQDLLVSEKVLDIMEYEKRQQKITHSQARLSFIITLRRQNQEASLVLKELNKTISQPIEISLVKWQDRVIWIEGYSHSDLELIDWVNQIRKSPVLAHPVITSIGDRNKLRYFELRMGLK